MVALTTTETVLAVSFSVLGSLAAYYIRFHLWRSCDASPSNATAHKETAPLLGLHAPTGGGVELVPPPYALAQAESTVARNAALNRLDAPSRSAAVVRIALALDASMRTKGKATELAAIHARKCAAEEP